MLEPKDVEIPTQKGESRVYVLSKFPAIAGREIIAKYPLSSMPKVGDYSVNEETMLKLMAYVGVRNGDDPDKVQRLTTRALVDNHVPDWETLARLEIAMMEYNVSFFGNGKASGLLDAIARKAQALILPMLTDLSGQLLQKTKPQSTNSEPSTR